MNVMKEHHVINMQYVLTLMAPIFVHVSVGLQAMEQDVVVSQF